VGEAHFGGFLKMKKKESPDEMDVDEKGKSRKDIIEELIMSNKAKKLEKAKQGDEYLSKVGQLNTMFKDGGIMSLVQSTRTKKEELIGIMASRVISESATRESLEETPQPPEEQAFGRLLRELKFDPKPARVDQVQARGVVTSVDMGMDWDLGARGPVGTVLIPGTYNEYIQLLSIHAKDWNDQYDQEMFCYINHKMIDNHLVAHRGKLSDLCQFLLQFTLILADAVDIYDQKCVVNFTPHIFHRIIESSPNPAELADLFLEKIKDAHDGFISFSPRSLKDSDVSRDFPHVLCSFEKLCIISLIPLSPFL